MRTILRSAPALATVAMLLWATTGVVYGAIGGSRSDAGGKSSAAERAASERTTSGEYGPGEQPPVYEADCRIQIEGSRATAYCHNAYPVTDRVQMHVECERWWDIDQDSAPAEVGPAQYLELTGRCWKEIRAVWVSQRPLTHGAGR
ncbi:hypothetical protein ACWEFL_30365 [Streptomyces sp. NPDC004838]